MLHVDVMILKEMTWTVIQLLRALTILLDISDQNEP